MIVNWDEAYSRLYEIINAEGDSSKPYYYSGPKFMNILRECDYTVPIDYTQYINTRKERGLSTTRIIYYKDLLDSLSEENREKAYLSFIAQLTPYNLEKLDGLKKMFIKQGDQTIQKIEVPDPQLGEECYNDILLTIDKALKNLEQMERIYSKMGEEEIRDYLIPYLATRYKDTTATRESFNKSGKTDILLKHTDNSNLFVAECKIWKGAQGLHDAIYQLFDSYLTWRDSKVALLFFVHNVNLSAVIKTIKSEVPKHPYYDCYIKDSNETSFSYIFHFPTDTDRKIQLEIMVFHFPLKKED
ncbi:hypothetical protein [Parabacteroides gordonii]|uniref:Uncharacterized protein n=1 Tax=Parabacteroides gordonii MS-1 = DSM 23371 TaxID=1203610 RepID=A0A0F5JC55_9BACT|nr:hypothetical protein [Parabacteroides gordonii]KKB55313.1 hypothetical protein HMPREF1536_02778 [Parabacteroides gordonii MS-1 = DSM 23371]MCA5581892.1 hypothetical protein [Parabacteroides gordonii]